MKSLQNHRIYEQVIQLKKIALDNTSLHKHKRIASWNTNDFVNFIKKTENQGKDVEKEFCKSIGLL